MTLVTLLPASAAFSQRDVLVTSPGSAKAVYYLANDGKRYVFPNQKTYNTWFTSFSGVVTISDADLMSFPLGGNVTYRPGIRLVKITTDPKVYAVDAGGTLRWVTSQAAASAIYGSNWNTKIDDVPDPFFVNYRIGADIYSAADFSPHAVAGRTLTINSDKNISATSAALRANTTPNAPQPTTTPVEVPPSSTSCTIDVWVCSSWNACSSNGSQVRTCQLATDCPNATSASPATTQSCTFTPSTGGSGAVSIEGTSDASNVEAGTDTVLARFRLSAQHEDLRLVKASFSVATAAAVQTLRLYDGDTPVSVSAGVDGSGNAHFSDVDFLIPRNTSKDLIVRGTLNVVGPSGVPAGSNARVTMRTTSGPYRFEMRSAQPQMSTLITAIPGGDKVGNDKLVHRTVISLTNVPLPTTVLTPGDVVAGRVKVSASAAGDAALKSVTVHVQKPTGLELNITGSGSQSTLRVQGNGSNVAGDSTAIGCDTGSSFCVIRTTFEDELGIGAGSSVTLDVRLSVVGTVTNNDAIVVTLPHDATAYTGGLTNGSDADQVRIDGHDVNFAWSDGSGAPHDADVGGSSADWSSGTYITGLPNDVQVMAK